MAVMSQLRNVPEHLHRVLRTRAAPLGKSLSNSGQRQRIAMLPHRKMPVLG